MKEPGISASRPTPRLNGKVQRYNRILAEELLYARIWTSEQQRTDALNVWNIHYNYHRPHTTAGNRPPATRLLSFPVRQTRRVWGQVAASGGRLTASNVAGLCIPILEWLRFGLYQHSIHSNIALASSSRVLQVLESRSSS